MAPIAAILFLRATEAYAETDKVQAIIGRASIWFLTIIVSLGVIMVLVGAFFFVTSAGDEKKVEKGKSTILWGMAGVAVAFLASSLIKLVEKLVK